MSVDYNAASSFLGNDRKRSSGNGIGQMAVASVVGHLLSERHDEHRWEKKKLLTEDLYHERREREYARRRADRRDARAVAAEHDDRMAQARRARQTQWREQDDEYAERRADKRHVGQLRRDAERLNQRREHMAKDFAVQAQGKGKIEQARAAGKVAGQEGNFPSDWTPRWESAGPDPTKPAASQPAPVRSAPESPAPSSVPESSAPRRSAPASQPAPVRSAPVSQAVSTSAASTSTVGSASSSSSVSPVRTATPSTPAAPAVASPRQSNVPAPAKPPTATPPTAKPPAANQPPPASAPAVPAPVRQAPARPDPTKPANEGATASASTRPRPPSIPVTRPPISDEVDGMPFISRKRHPDEYSRLDNLNRKISKQGNDVRVAGGRVSNVGAPSADTVSKPSAPESSGVLVGDDGAKRMGSDYVRGVQALGRAQRWVSKKLGSPKTASDYVSGADAGELQHRLGDQKFAQGTILRRDKQTGALAPDMRRTGNVRVYPNPDKPVVPAASMHPARKPAAPLPEGPMSRIRQISAGDSGVSVGNDAQPFVRVQAVKKRSHVPVPPAIASLSKGKPVSPTAPHRVWGNPLFTDKHPLIGDEVALKPKPNTLAPKSSGMRTSNVSLRSSSDSGPKQTALNIPAGPKVAKVSQPKISRKGKSPKINDNPLF